MSFWGTVRRVGAGVASGGLTELFGVGDRFDGSKQRRDQADYDRFMGTLPEAGPMPEQTPYQSIMQGGQLPDNMKARYGGDINADPRGMNAFRDMALNGNSAWMNMMNKKQGIEERGLADQAMGRAASGTATAQSNLAMRGGLSGGARERIQNQGMRDMMSARQDISQQGALARSNIGIEGERQRLGFLERLPGQEIASLAPAQQNREMQMKTDMFNAGNSMQGAQWDMENRSKWDELAMKRWGAKSDARAAAVANRPGSGFFG